MARRASFFRYRRLAKRRPLSRRGIFVLRRDSKQAAEFAISMCENRPFWKINASLRPGGGRRSISVWDYRLRLVVKKYFNYENDPFFGSSFKKSTPVDADVSPFSVFNNLSSRAVVAKGVARAFYSRSIVAFKNDFERGRGGKKFARS
jgi:hypothetical protein